MGYKKTDPCIKNAFPDERLFVLMARDRTAPYVVIEWIKQSLNSQPPAKLHEALDAAIEMIKTQPVIDIRKRQQKAKAENKKAKEALSKTLPKNGDQCKANPTSRIIIKPRR